MTYSHKCRHEDTTKNEHTFFFCFTDKQQQPTQPPKQPLLLYHHRTFPLYCCCCCCRCCCCRWLFFTCMASLAEASSPSSRTSTSSSSSRATMDELLSRVVGPSTAWVVLAVLWSLNGPTERNLMRHFSPAVYSKAKALAVGATYLASPVSWDVSSRNINALAQTVYISKIFRKIIIAFFLLVALHCHRKPWPFFNYPACGFYLPCHSSIHHSMPLLSNTAIRPFNCRWHKFCPTCCAPFGGPCCCPNH